MEIRIDVAPNSPLSHYAQEQALEKLFDRGAISFEEYVEALDENATAPKSKLEQIVKRRKIAETEAVEAFSSIAPSGAP